MPSAVTKAYSTFAGLTCEGIADPARRSPVVLLAERYLSRLGHQISGFTDPQESLEVFRIRPQDFDIVVTDLSMPRMSGYEFAREMLSVRSGIRTGESRGAADRA